MRAAGIASALAGCLLSSTLHAQAGLRAASAASQQPVEEIVILGERPGPQLWKVTNGEHKVVDAARAVQYTNAGTFEFLLDDKGNFFFLEVNTRVQVEHPVTEFITGIDIVKEQIRVAAGERLSFKQGDVTFTGHSIECRVNAEDPVTFAPSPGVIHAFSVPGGPGVRVDTFAHSECTITPYYDSMIAKIIVHGRDRQEAIARMRRTLEMTVIEGIKTSIPLHLKILKDPDFIAGRLGTSFMERYMPEQKKPGAGLAEAV